MAGMKIEVVWVSRDVLMDRVGLKLWCRNYIRGGMA